jgi:hypothetical protein
MIQIKLPGLYRTASGEVAQIHYVGEVAAGRINNGPQMLWNPRTGWPLAPKPRGKNLTARTLVARILTIRDRSR